MIFTFICSISDWMEWFNRIVLIKKKDKTMEYEYRNSNQDYSIINIIIRYTIIVENNMILDNQFKRRRR